MDPTTLAQLQAWIRQAMAQGKSQAELQQTLANMGYTQADLSQAFSGISTAPAAPVVSTAPVSTPVVATTATAATASGSSTTLIIVIAIIAVVVIGIVAAYFVLSSPDNTTQGTGTGSGLNPYGQQGGSGWPYGGTGSGGNGGTGTGSGSGTGGTGTGGSSGGTGSSGGSGSGSSGGTGAGGGSGGSGGSSGGNSGSGSQVLQQLRAQGLTPFSCSVDYDVTSLSSGQQMTMGLSLALKYTVGKMKTKMSMDVPGGGSVMDYVIITNVDAMGKMTSVEKVAMCFFMENKKMCSDMTAMMNDLMAQNPQMNSAQSTSALYDPSAVQTSTETILGRQAICFKIPMKDIDEYIGCINPSASCPMPLKMTIKDGGVTQMTMIATSIDESPVPDSEFNVDTSGSLDLSELMKNYQPPQ